MDAERAEQLERPGLWCASISDAGASIAYSYIEASTLGALARCGVAINDSHGDAVRGQRDGQDETRRAGADL
jgi:hypothetical protein